MKYHIRSLAIILSLVMIFSVASVGCRSNDDSSTTSTVSSKTERKKKIIVIKKKRESSASSSTSSPLIAKTPLTIINREIITQTIIRRSLKKYLLLLIKPLPH